MGYERPSQFLHVTLCFTGYVSGPHLASRLSGTDYVSKPYLHSYGVPQHRQAVRKMRRTLLLPSKRNHSQMLQAGNDNQQWGNTEDETMRTALRVLEETVSGIWCVKRTFQSQPCLNSTIQLNIVGDRRLLIILRLFDMYCTRGCL